MIGWETRKSPDQTRVYSAYAAYAIAGWATTQHQCAHMRSLACDRHPTAAATGPRTRAYQSLHQLAGVVHAELHSLLVVIRAVLNLRVRASECNSKKSRWCSPACRPRFRCKRGIYTSCAVRWGQIARPPGHQVPPLSQRFLNFRRDALFFERQPIQSAATA